MVRIDPQSELLCKEVALRYNSIDGCYIMLEKTSAGVVTGQVSNKAFSRANLASRIRIEADSMGLLHGQTSGKGLRGAMAAEDALRIFRDVLCIAGVVASSALLSALGNVLRRTVAAIILLEVPHSDFAL